MDAFLHCLGLLILCQAWAGLVVWGSSQGTQCGCSAGGPFCVVGVCTHVPAAGLTLDGLWQRGAVLYPHCDTKVQCFQSMRRHVLVWHLCFSVISVLHAPRVSVTGFAAWPSQCRLRRAMGLYRDLLRLTCLGRRILSYASDWSSCRGPRLRFWVSGF